MSSRIHSANQRNLLNPEEAGAVLQLALSHEKYKNMQRGNDEEITVFRGWRQSFLSFFGAKVRQKLLTISSCEELEK